MIMPNALFGLASFVFLVIATPLALRMKQSNVFVLPLCAIVVDLLAASIAKLISPAISFWLFTPPYFLLASLFIFCVGAVFSSVSLEILYKIFRCGGRVNPSTLSETLVRNGMKARIAEHLRNGAIAQIDDRLDLTPNGRKIVLVVERLKTIFALTSNGIY